MKTKDIIYIVIIFILLFIIYSLISGKLMINNNKNQLIINEYNNYNLVYGKTGLPKNCRAIIYENIKQYNEGNNNIKDTLNSIERNCGKNGYSWPSK